MKTMQIWANRLVSFDVLTCFRWNIWHFLPMNDIQEIVAEISVLEKQRDELEAELKKVILLHSVSSCCLHIGKFIKSPATCFYMFVSLYLHICCIVPSFYFNNFFVSFIYTYSCCWRWLYTLLKQMFCIFLLFVGDWRSSQVTKALQIDCYGIYKNDLSIQFISLFHLNPF